MASQKDSQPKFRRRQQLLAAGVGLVTATLFGAAFPEAAQADPPWARGYHSYGYRPYKYRKVKYRTVVRPVPVVVAPAPYVAVPVYRPVPVRSPSLRVGFGVGVNLY